jgi:hypothetical protein
VRLEVSAAAKFGVQAIMVQETDPRHGSVPLSEHRDDCPESARAHLFGPHAYSAILWYREAHYKYTGVRQIVQQLLAVDPGCVTHMVFPGELSQRPLKLPPVDHVRAKHFWLPAFAPWCAQLKDTLEKGMPGLVVELAEPGTFVKSISKIKAGNRWGNLRGNTVRRASVAMQNLVKQVGGLLLSAVISPELFILHPLTYMLLVSVSVRAWIPKVVSRHKNQYASNLPAHAMLVPLNEDTLLNPAVQDDIYEAIQANMQVVLLHMREAEFGAVPFARFFEQCPDNLRDAGLFDTPACTWHSKEPYLTVSMKLLGMRLEDNRASAESSGWKAIGNAATIVQKDIKTAQKDIKTLSKKNVSRAVVPTDDGPTENARSGANIVKVKSPEQTNVQAFETPLESLEGGVQEMGDLETPLESLEGGAQEMGDRASAASRATNPTKTEGDFGEL